MFWLYVAILAMFVFINPTLKYWNIIIKNKMFTSKVHFFFCSFFSTAFNMALLYFVLKICEINKVASVIPYFLLFQGSLFSILIVLLPLIYILLQTIHNKIFTCFMKNNFIDRIRAKSKESTSKFKNAVKDFYTNYFVLDNTYKLNFLQGDIIKKYLIGFYIVTGIITVSGLTNSLIIDMFSIPNIPTDKVSITDQKIDLLKRDMEIYSNIFLITALPMLISAFVNKKLDPGTEKQSDEEIH